MSLDIIEIAEYINSKGINNLYRKAVERGDTEGFIVDLNTRDQFGVRNEDSTGRKLADIGGGYSVTTQVIKGLSATKVNLFDTGDYWESFKVEYTRGGFIISSNPVKEDGNLEVRYGENLEGLNDINLKKVEDFIEDRFWKDVENNA